VYKPPHICAQCENQNNPVTTENGFTFRYQVTKETAVEMWLHNSCSEAWWQDFGFTMAASA
jgi:hypothetical protein